MRTFAPNTKSEKVVEELRKTIRTGNGLEAGRRLKSVRVLASEFSVSARIVQRALDALEAEHLIRREQGRGVFVKDFRKSRSVEVVVIGLSPGGMNSYARRVAGFLYSPYCRPGYNFTLRSFAPQRSSDSKQLLEEFRKIVNFQNPDCVLIHSVHLSRKEVEEILEGPVPVIFLGQFAASDIDDLNFSQICHRPESVTESAVSAMLENHPFRKFIFLTGSLRYAFNQRGLCGARMAAERHQAELEVLELPARFSGFSASERRNVVAEVCPYLMRREGLPVFCSGTSFFPDLLPENVFRGRDFFSEDLPSDKNHFFYAAVYDEMNHLLKHPSVHHKIVLEDACGCRKIRREGR